MAQFRYALPLPATNWLGQTSGSWAAANWASDATGTPTVAIPTSADDVTFSATGAANQGATTLDQDFTIHSLTVTDTTPVVISSGAGGPFTLTIAGNAGTGITVATGANLTINSNVTLGGASDTIEVDGTGVASITGTLNPTNGLNKTGTGMLTLGGANTYSTATTVSAGTLNITGTNTGGGSYAINGDGSTLTINSSGTVAASGVTFGATGTETLNLNGGTFLVGAGGISTPAVSGTGLVFNGGTLQSSAAFTISSDLPISILRRPAPSDTSGGNITSNSGFGFTASSGNLTVQGGNTLTAAFDSPMSGEIFVTGNTTLALATTSATSGVLSIASGSTLDLNNSSASFAGLTGGGSVINSTGAGVSTLTITGTGGNNFSGVISAATPADTAVTINLTSGTQIFSGANTYGGATTIQNGTLQVGIDNALPVGTTVTLNNAAGSGNAILDINGHNQTIAGLTIIAPENHSTVDVNGGTLTLMGDVNLVDNTSPNKGNGEPSNINDTAGGGALDLGGAVRTFNIAGQNVGNQELNVNTTIQNGGVIINAVNSSTVFNSAGVNFTGANTYAGGTTINSGYLLVNNTTGSGTGTGAVIINSGGTLAGTGTVTGPVTLNSGGAIEAGYNGVGHGTQGTLTLGAVTWNGGGKVNLELGTTSDLLALTGALTKGTAGAYTITITDAGGIGNQFAYTLSTFASTTFLASDFTLALPAGYSGALLETTTSLNLALIFTASGNLIENVGGPNTPIIADFTVNGQVGTGGPLANNTIRSLIFTPGDTLTITNTLTLTSGNVTTTGGNSTITGGTLFGPNGLHFDVNGNLFIGSTLIGNTVKTGTGSLFLDGALFGNMTVLQGLLGGNGTIIGNLFNAGTVSPGHSPGQIHVTGNYTQSPAGTLKIEIGGTDISQHDLLSVGGTASLNGTLQLVQLNNFQLKRNQSVAFLIAGGGVEGRFSMVQNGFVSNTILQPTVVYGSNSVVLEALQGSFAALPGLTPNQQAVGRALDSAANDRHANKLFDYLDYRTLNKLPGDLEKISPEELTSVYTLGVSLATVQSLNIQRRTDDIRRGTSGFNAANLALNGDGPSYSGGFGLGSGVAGPNGSAVPSGDDGKEVKETAPVAPAENRWGVFLSGTGEWVSVGDTSNARGYDLESGGFTLGVDYKVTPNLAIGLAAGYTGTTADLTDHGRIWVNGGQIGLYGTFFQNAQAAPAPTMSKDSSKEAPAPAPAPSVAKGLYADVAVFGGYNSYDTRRSALQGEARGSTDGGELNVLFGTGYDFKAGGLTFGPTATFNYTYIGTSGFDESGSLAPLSIHGGHGESLRSAFGLKASYDWKVGGIIIRPEVRAAWQHEYGDAAYAMDSSFASGAGNSFLVNGPKLGRDSALLGAGFAIQCSERCSTYFYYDGEVGRTNYQSTNVTGGVRVSF